ncbi:MAG TPA: flagellar biosynthetic protein FliR [Candidatus Avisuccinivibrio pullicola]|nr:flagellar biosynthetic protein FliR [Candidatus Avisuccinivibrio pullicola]
MDFSEPLLLNGLASILWPLCRVSGFLMTMFIISGSTVPTVVRALFCLALTVCVLPGIPELPESPQLFSGEGILTTIMQVLIGAALGFMTIYLSQAFIIAGQAVAMQTGLGFASLVDPVSGTNTPVVGQFFTVLCTLVFFAVDGHLIFIRLMLLSFSLVPIGPQFLSEEGLTYLIFFGATMFQTALAMSMSAICTMLVVNFTFGVMTRAAPQLNVFSMGFAVSMVVGLFVLWYSLNAFMGNFTQLANTLMAETCSLMGGSCEGVF